MERTPEPELMEDLDQAAAYAAADFASVNADFVARFRSLAPGLTAGRVIDLGCGPGDILERLCTALPGLEAVGLDGSAAMLAHAHRAFEAAGLAERVRWVEGRLPEALPAERFDAVLSNSLLHHLPDPAVLWDAVGALAASGAWVQVVDLLRPTAASDVDRLVETYAADEPPVLQRDFHASLHAAFSVDEVWAQLQRAGFAGDLALEVISDRHWAVTGRLS
ncbi:MAG: class I SAM-dependent methyltransferase [Myxococcota bacterium]